MRLEKYFDHTNLKPEAKEVDIDQLCAEAKKYEFASVCVNPSYVKYARKQLQDSNVKVCTVIGFPLGANTTEIKVDEAKRAIKDEADEVDMVINVGKLKDKQYNYIKEEINEIKQEIKKHVLKVIVETCLLDEDEKRKICEIILETKADFIKTSTGFGKPKDERTRVGADLKDIKLFKNIIGNRRLQIKASGGIGKLSEAEKMIKAGATRIGASKSVSIMEEFLSK